LLTRRGAPWSLWCVHCSICDPHMAWHAAY
jgi:hypothetical protein